ncbi:hypothetical protein CR513_18291, partial [Mucuna pruriens]
MVLTVCFPKNRMPSSSFDNEISHSIIFPNEPLFHIPPHVFGCTCFVHDVSSSLDKLFVRAIKYVFFGYSHLQKGYWHYFPITKKYYMTIDVTIFEETPFFSSSSQNTNIFQQVLPTPIFNPQLKPPLDEESSESCSTPSITPTTNTSDKIIVGLLLFKKVFNLPETLILFTIF